MLSKLFLSPLRYPGSKRRLTSYIEKTLKANNFKPLIYVEPFVGGASVALHFLDRGLVQKVILADQDPWIANFWYTVFWDTDWLISQIEQVSITLDYWKELKKVQPCGTRQQAWTCLFLNRTNFSGILRQEVGPLGGRKQKSVYKIDCRFPRQTLIDRIKYIATFRDQIYAVWNVSWEQAFERIQEEQSKGNLSNTDIFFYLDPPFFKKADALYRHYFEPDDHVRLRDALLKMNDKWLLSYDSAQQVEALYGPAIKDSTNGTKKSSIELLYSLSVLRKRKHGKEVILSNLGVLPEFNNN